MNENNTGKFYGIGVGPGDPDLLTQKAVKVLSHVDVVFDVSGRNTKISVSGAILDSLEQCRAERINLFFSMDKNMEDRKKYWKENAVTVASVLKEGRNCAFVTIGDPLFYSTYTYLLREVKAIIPDVEIETIPGITSFQAAMAKTNIPLVENEQVLTVIPAWTKESIEHPAIGYSDSVIYMKAFKQRTEIIESLKKQGFGGDLIYASRLGMEDERVVINPEDITEHPEEYLSLLCVKRTSSDRSMD